MWFAFTVFLILWLISMHMLLPAPVVYTFLTAMLVTGGAALVERHSQKRGQG